MAVRLYRHLDQLPDTLRHGAVSIGNFDGVHRGHALIVQRLVAMARRVGGPALVFTFDPHPARLLRPEAAPMPLSWTERKADLLVQLGADAVLAYPTEQALLQLTAQEFFDRIVCQRLAARAMVEGQNFFFGHHRSGNVKVLREFCARQGVLLDVVEPVEIEGETTSSSRVRAAVAGGRVEDARAMLGRPHRIRGTVVRGAGRGRRLGYPTANLAQVDTMLPGHGIYAGRTHVDGDSYPAAVSIGPNPTFGEGELKVEAHLIGYQGSLYDRVVELDFLGRLRDIKRFASADELVGEMNRDVETTIRINETCVV